MEIKLYDLFKYNIPAFIRNTYQFRKELWKYRSWDSAYSLMMLRRGLEQTAKSIELGYEEETSRLKKVEKIKRTVVLLDNFINDNFIEQTEKELGIEVVNRISFTEYKPDDEDETNNRELCEIIDTCTEQESENNRKIFARRREIEVEQWKELFDILKGQDYNIDNMTEEEYDNFYDGSGILGWWD